MEKENKPRDEKSIMSAVVSEFLFFFIFLYHPRVTMLKIISCEQQAGRKGGLKQGMGGEGAAASSGEVSRSDNSNICMPSWAGRQSIMLNMIILIFSTFREPFLSERFNHNDYFRIQSLRKMSMSPMHGS